MKHKLECREITKKYGTKTVLDGVTLTLEPHRIYGLIGRNGAGKTTLLGILSGQNGANGGEAMLDGQPVYDNQAALDEICFARELNTTVMFGRDTRKVKQLLLAARMLFPYWDEDYAKTLIEAFELDINKRVAGQSKGMLSALTIVIALASKSPITFLDEPVAGLDVFMREKFYKLLLDEYMNSERTFVVSTHIIDEAANVLEDVIMLDGGKILRQENTDELLSRHRMVSGLAEEIDKFCEGRKVVHSETQGRSKTVCVEIDDMAAFKADAAAYDFDISKASLQKLFMQLLG
ncbi:MAG: ABC transporter ATP-binding protein [Ruminococcaceae bacterium]|nr:ABC transporter ATP-binding protein [Oscillospiraceae bacterium]